MLEDGPLEDCPHPVALQVCRESRQHTLRQYVATQHREFKAGSFFFSPYRDVLFLTLDFTDEPSHLREVEHHYGSQLKNINAVLLEEVDWTQEGPASYTSSHLTPFGDLDEILLVYGDYNEDGDILPVVAEELRSRASYFKEQYQEFITAVKDRKGTARCIKYMDRSGKFY